jgi:hypothetical protein
MDESAARPAPPRRHRRDETGRGEGDARVNTGTARRLVVVSLLVSGGVITYDVLRGETRGELGAGDAFRVIWAVGLLFLLLTIAADVVPSLAGPLAGLIALSILIGRSGAVNEIANVIPSGKGGVK